MCEVIFNILKESLQNNSVLDQLDYCINPEISDNSITINIESYTITLSFIPLLQLKDLHQNPCKEDLFLNKLCLKFFHSLISNIFYRYKHQLSTTVYKEDHSFDLTPPILVPVMNSIYHAIILNNIQNIISVVTQQWNNYDFCYNTKIIKFEAHNIPTAHNKVCIIILFNRINM